MVQDLSLGVKLLLFMKTSYCMGHVIWFISNHIWIELLGHVSDYCAAAKLFLKGFFRLRSENLENRILTLEIIRLAGIIPKMPNSSMLLTWINCCWDLCWWLGITPPNNSLATPYISYTVVHHPQKRNKGNKIKNIIKMQPVTILTIFLNFHCCRN